jgi:hypothetical protein
MMTRTCSRGDRWQVVVHEESVVVIATSSPEDAVAPTVKLVLYIADAGACGVTVIAWSALLTVSVCCALVRPDDEAVI